MKKIIALGIAVFLLALLLKTPASIITSQLESTLPVSLQGVRGSLWSGKAMQVSYKGIELGEAKWSVNPLAFLTGSAKGAFSVAGNNLEANGNYKASISKTLTLDNTEFQISSELINKLQRYTRLSGDFRGAIDLLELTGRAPLQPPLVEGIINWEQGGVKSPFPIPEGSYQLRLEPGSADTLVGLISSHDSPMEIKGNVKLDKAWAYETDLKVVAPESNRSLNNMLSMAGKRQADGSFQIKQNGRLPFN